MRSGAVEGRGGVFFLKGGSLVAGRRDANEPWRDTMGNKPITAIVAHSLPRVPPNAEIHFS